MALNVTSPTTNLHPVSTQAPLSSSVIKSTRVLLSSLTSQRGRAVLLSGALLASVFAPLSLSFAAAPSVYPNEPQSYEVGPNDTLWDIAQRFDTNPDTLAAANRLSNPNHIVVGQQLDIPASVATTTVGQPPVPPASHTVAAGDTLTSIARSYSTSIDALARANGLTDSDVITIGRKLVIAPQAKSLLRNNRMVSYYGMPGFPTMGVLGQLNHTDLVRSVKERAAAYTALGGKPAIPTLQIVAVQAMRDAQSDGKYRRRMDQNVIRQYVELARANGLQIILDIQPGSSSITDEIEALRPFLIMPHVHLALDAEYAVPPDVRPGGGYMGSLDASAISGAIKTLADIVAQYGGSNKVLMVHQFVTSSITNRETIVNNPLVDLVINMDGIGPQDDKTKTYNKILGNQTVAFPGLQIFLTHDKAPFSPAEALRLSPAPDVVVYF